MLMSSIFRENLLDDFFDYSFGNHKTFDMTNTDIKDTENGYEITVNMSGIRKEDVEVELEDGYLAVQATIDSSRDEEGSNRTYIRRERYYGSCSRNFYVGDTMTREDIRAKFEDGILKALVPRRETKPAMEERKYIAVEG